MTTRWPRRLLYALTGSTHPFTRPVAPRGRAVRAVIAPAGCGGYLLFIEYHRREWIGDMPTRFETYDSPDDREFTAAATALAARGLAPVGAWQPGEHGTHETTLTILPEPEVSQ
jgi:hypothetical protein